MYKIILRQFLRCYLSDNFGSYIKIDFTTSIVVVIVFDIDAVEVTVAAVKIVERKKNMELL